MLFSREFRLGAYRHEFVSPRLRLFRLAEQPTSNVLCDFTQPLVAHFLAVGSPHAGHDVTHDVGDCDVVARLCTDKVWL